MSTKRSKRRSFTIHEKRQYVIEMEASGLSVRAFAAKINVNETVIRRWKESMPVFDENIKRSRKMRNKPRKKCGMHPELDIRVLEWVRFRNQKGIRVKDSFIQARAKAIREELLTEMDPGPEKQSLAKFQASRMWVHRFKKRHNLRSRRHTTTHTLPENFRQLSTDFIETVHQVIERYDIKRDFVLNFDQVPRYYEQDKSTTIARSGDREILLGRSSTSHKRFTWTPFVTASGKFALKHVLFSKLKNVPKHHASIRVDVNNTGMFSTEILKKTVDEAIQKVRGVLQMNEHILMILDSYGVHVKFEREQKAAYEAKKVHFVLVPPRLTGLNQPLDVVLNRSQKKW